jgi:tetratricopeptide (TPR) repeat protein
MKPRYPREGIRTGPFFIQTLFLFFLLVGFENICNSKNLVPEEDLPLVLEGMKKISNAEYEEGFSLFQRYIDKYPLHPSGYFFMSAAYELMMQYTNTESGLKPFEKYSRRCLEIVQTNLREDPFDEISLFYYGALQGYIGLQHARHRSLLQAFRSAYNARMNLERALELDPDLYDAYLGLGMLFYYASKKHLEEGGVVGWFLRRFITHNEDLRGKGMEMVQLAMDRGELSGTYAKRALMWMNLLEKNYEAAYAAAREIAEEAPNDKNCRWVMARVELVQKNYQLSNTHFEEISRLVEKENLDTKVFQDVWMGSKLATVGNFIQVEDYRGAENLNRTVLEWLGNNPTASIEFQDERNLFAYWQELCQQFAESIQNGQKEYLRAGE